MAKLFFPKFFRSLPSKRAQSMVEFALALPVLLMLLFGIIEFGRFLQAWLALENGARFGVRFAVTGSYDPAYCEEAAIALNLQSADLSDGAYDCRVSQSYSGLTPGSEQEEADQLSNQLIDWARMPSIRDAALAGATGLAWNPAVSGDYNDYLDNAYATAALDTTFWGSPQDAGFFDFTVCSNRVLPNNQGGFRFNPNPVYFTPNDPAVLDAYRFPIYCEQANAAGTGVVRYVDDAGGPGDRVRVVLTYRHRLITPFLQAVWPTLRINAQREGLVEKFRTSRVTGLTGAIAMAATHTYTPTNTLTPSETPLPTNTPTQAFCQGTGSILRQNWWNIAGTSIQDLHNDPNYPYNPSEISYPGSFDMLPINAANNYGTRFMGWVCPPLTGAYTFYISGDDESKLYLSGSESAAGKVEIASVSSWSDYQQWDKYSSQESNPVILQGGQFYWIEAEHKEGGGGDNLSVGWTGPGIGTNIQVIDGLYLRPADVLPTPVLTATPIPVYCEGTGSILRQTWYDIGSGNSTSELLNHPDYPANPDVNAYPGSFEIEPYNFADRYGSRFAGWVCPPADGEYTFYISSDDNSQLYLSGDDSASNKVEIASVNGWTSSRSWFNSGSQQSNTYTLQGGQFYWIEAHHKEGTGGDNLAVGWTGPIIGSDVQVIDGLYLRPAQPFATPTPTATPTASCDILENMYKYDEALTFRLPNEGGNALMTQLLNNSVYNVKLTGASMDWTEVWHNNLQGPRPGHTFNYYSYPWDTSFYNPSNTSNYPYAHNFGSSSMNIPGGQDGYFNWNYSPYNFWITPEVDHYPGTDASRIANAPPGSARPPLNFFWSGDFDGVIYYDIVPPAPAPTISCDMPVTGRDGPSIQLQFYVGSGNRIVGRAIINGNDSGVDTGWGVWFYVYDQDGRLVHWRRDTRSRFCLFSNGDGSIGGCPSRFVHLSNWEQGGGPILPQRYTMVVIARNNHASPKAAIAEIELDLRNIGYPTATFTPTVTRTPTRTYTATLTYTPTRTFTATHTFTPTRTPTNTWTPTVTRTPTRTHTPTITPTRTNTPVPSNTPTPTNTIQVTPTNTFTPCPPIELGGCG